MRALIAILLIALSTGALAGPGLTADETRLIKEVRFDIDLMTRVKANGLGFERLEGVTATRQTYPAAGLVLIAEPTSAGPTLQTLRRMFGDTGYRAYVYYEGVAHQNDLIAIVRNVDDAGYLALVRPAGPDENVTHELVMDLYRKYDRDFGFVLTGAGPDWLEAKTTRDPISWVPIARDVQRLCRRNCIGEGAETPEILGAGMRRSTSLYISWE